MWEEEMVWKTAIPFCIQQQVVEGFCPKRMTINGQTIELSIVNSNTKHSSRA
jgi:hypothetical protein